MEGLIEEGQELLKEKPDPDVLDAGLISKAQHIEHYEIAGYGTVRTYAELLGETRQAQLLQQTLDEEGQTDKLLTELAESSINIDAASGSRSAEREVPRRTAVESSRSGARTGRGRRTGGRASRESEATSR
jgi:ferritin-like metal-binding protein YciE